MSKYNWRQRLFNQNTRAHTTSPPWHLRASTGWPASPTSTHPHLRHAALQPRAHAPPCKRANSINPCLPSLSQRPALLDPPGSAHVTLGSAQAHQGALNHLSPWAHPELWLKLSSFGPTREHSSHWDMGWSSHMSNIDCRLSPQVGILRVHVQSRMLSTKGPHHNVCWDSWMVHGGKGLIAMFAKTAGWCTEARAW